MQTRQSRQTSEAQGALVLRWFHRPSIGPAERRFLIPLRCRARCARPLPILLLPRALDRHGPWSGHSVLKTILLAALHRPSVHVAVVLRWGIRRAGNTGLRETFHLRLGSRDHGWWRPQSERRPQGFYSSPSAPPFGLGLREAAWPAAR